MIFQNNFDGALGFYFRWEKSAALLPALEIERHGPSTAGERFGDASPRGYRASVFVNSALTTFMNLRNIPYQALAQNRLRIFVRITLMCGQRGKETYYGQARFAVSERHLGRHRH